MLFTTLSLGLVLLPFAAAQQVYDVQVGSSNGTSLTFNPEAIVCAFLFWPCSKFLIIRHTECTTGRSSCLPLVGGQMNIFTCTKSLSISSNPKNHSVTQSSFAGPCSFKDGGFDSGFMPVAANVTDNLPTYTIQVNDTQPIWVYCAQAAGLPASHCGAGMVFAVNCGADGSPNSFTNFKNSALQIGASLSSAAAASSTAASSVVASGVATAAYGSVTIPPAVRPPFVANYKLQYSQLNVI